jgi:hypothetical protein
MYRVRLCAAAEGVTVDRDSGSVSIFILLDRLTAEGFPVLFQKVSFVVIWDRDATDEANVEGRFSVHLGEHELYTQPTAVDFRDALRNQTVFTLFGLTIPAPGRMIFRMTLPNGGLAEYPVEVVAAAGAVRATVAQQPRNPT